jgi:hypothetical protein
MKKLIIGDIFEIATSKGNAYLHYAFKDNTLGDLIRVLPGLYQNIPLDLDKLVLGEEDYFLYFPVCLACRRKLVIKVGHNSVKSYSKPKFMRSDEYLNGEFRCWHIINSETWKRESVQILSTEQKKLSAWGHWSFPLLIENLENNWNLENWKPYI